MKGEAQGIREGAGDETTKAPQASPSGDPSAYRSGSQFGKGSGLGDRPSRVPRRAPSPRRAPPRLSVPDRQQLLSAMTIDELLEPDLPARAVWAYVEGLDLTPLFDHIRARGRVAGRPAIDPAARRSLVVCHPRGLHQRSRA